jgi:hypothetical protein
LSDQPAPGILTAEIFATAMVIIGFLVVAILRGLPNNIAGVFGMHFYTQPSWLPVMEFPWWICFGTIVTFCVAILFQSREHHPPTEL